jgi:hypothetical protein
MIISDLLHFTKLDIAMERILPYKRLRFSSLNNSHDPYEYKKRTILATSPNAVNNFNNIVNNYSRLICFTDGTPRQGGLGRSRMWSQFASSHTGVCLLFSSELVRKSLDENYRDNFYMLNNVSYSNFFGYKRQKYSRQKLDITDKEFEYVKENAEEIFFQKHPDYQNEDEIRLLVLDEGKSIEYFDITTSLTGVVLGDACHQSYHKYFLDYCKLNKLETHKCIYKNGELTIVGYRGDYDSYRTW